MKEKNVKIEEEKTFNQINYDNQIYKEDCVIGLSKIPSNSADIIITDPPYNIKKDFGVNKDNLSLNEYREWCAKWINECNRILKDGVLVIYMDLVRY